MNKIESICVFGDSTAWGAWDLEKGGWVNRLWFHVAKRSGDTYVEIYNQSISGGTTETILSRFESEAKIRSADAIIFQTGGNDASYEHAPNQKQRNGVRSPLRKNSLMLSIGNTSHSTSRRR